VHRKHAGTFGERSLSIGFVGIDAGASLEIAADGTTVLHHLLSGAVRIGDDGVHASGSALKWVAGETGSITAIESATLYEVRLPEFD
jgi:hypothetical protein